MMKQSFSKAVNEIGSLRELTNPVDLFPLLPPPTLTVIIKFSLNIDRSKLAISHSVI